MLWESADAELALAERFGFASYDEVSAWVSTALADLWQLRVELVERVAISDHNAICFASTDRGRVVVKWSWAEPLFERLGATTALLTHLADAGLPVARPVGIGGRSRVVVDGPAGPLSVVVLPEMSGTWLDVTDPAAVHDAGATLARVHASLASYDDPVLGTPPPSSLRARVGAWLAEDPGLAPEASRRLAEAVADLPDLDDEPQLVHWDFRAANLLTEHGRVSGVLDLDEVLTEHRVRDLAKACVFLGTLFTDWRPTPVAVRERLVAGYESVRPLGATERAWLEPLVLWTGIAALPGHDLEAWRAAL